MGNLRMDFSFGIRSLTRFCKSSFTAPRRHTLALLLIIPAQDDSQKLTAVMHSRFVVTSLLHQQLPVKDLSGCALVGHLLSLHLNMFDTQKSHNQSPVLNEWHIRCTALHVDISLGSDCWEWAALDSDVLVSCMVIHHHCHLAPQQCMGGKPFLAHRARRHQFQPSSAHSARFSHTGPGDLLATSNGKWR